jgi:hypothetical protein
VYSKFIEFLRLITDELLNKGKDLEDAIVKLDNTDINLFKVNEELREIESSHLIEDEDADAVRSVLIYLFMKNTQLELEDIYALVFGSGKKLIWH